MLSLRMALLGAALFPITALAADYGTYRPGNSYLSMPAQSPDQCISYCNGDAQCKGWNFVKVDQSRTICEFNTMLAAPIASPISISGESMSATNHPRLVPGGHRTIRVGQPAAQRTQTGNLARVGQAQPARRVVRTPTPQPDPRLQIANYRAPIAGIATPGSSTPPTNQRPPQRHTSFKPQLDVLASAPLPAPQRPQPPAMQPDFKPMLDSAASPQARQTPENMPRRPAAAPPTVQAEDINAIPRLSAMPDNRPNPSVESGLAGGPVALTLPPNSSLYGSLYDDVKAPRSLNAEDIPADPDAPIPTVSSVPVESLNVSTF